MRLSAHLLCASALVLGLSASPVLAQDARTIREAEQLRDRALDSNVAYDLVSELTTRFGPRLAGSASEQASARWGADKFREMGFDNVAIEPLLRDLIGLPAEAGLDGTDAPFQKVMQR